MIDAIVVPQGAEYKAVYNAIKKNQNSSFPIIPIPIGFNRVKAETIVTQILALNVRQVLMTGLCGSLSSQYSVGDVVLYQSCFDPHQQITLETDSQLTTAISQQLPNLSLVNSLTSDRVINLAPEKQQLYRTYQTDVVDMEGFSYLKLFQKHNLRVATLRVVSDDPQYDIPDLNPAISSQGNLKTLPLIITLINQPFAATRLIKGSLQGLAMIEKTVQKII